MVHIMRIDEWLKVKNPNWTSTTTQDDLPLDDEANDRNSFDSIPKQEQIEVTAKIMDDLWYLEETFPMFARYYNFGDGTKLYIWFKDYVYAGDENYQISDKYFTDEVVSRAKQYCGADRTAVDDLNYYGLPLLKLKKVAEEYLKERPMILKAVKGKTPTEVDDRYKEIDVNNFESNIVDFDYLEHIVAFEDIFTYRNGYFLKCFEEIDELDCCRTSIVEIMNKIRKGVYNTGEKWELTARSVYKG